MSRTYGFENFGSRLRGIAYLQVLQPPLDFGADFLTVTMNNLVPDHNGRFRKFNVIGVDWLEN
jgi:hypothetical protein